MAPNPNALSPEQIDAALGPELSNGGNELQPINEVIPADATGADDTAESGAAPEEEAEPQPEPEPAEPEPEPEPEDVPDNAAADSNIDVD